MRERTVLLINQSFPPFGGASSRRVTKMVKYLAREGWRSVVITAARVLQNDRDEAALAEVPADTVVVRTSTLEPVSSGPGHSGALLAIRRALNVPLVPSVAALWAAAALPAALSTCRRHGPDVILASGPDFSAHVLAALVSRARGVPLVVDYRDEWTTHPDRQRRIAGHPLRAAKNEVDRALERRCLAAARRVLLNTASFREPLIGTLRGDETKLEVLSNGFDPDELPETRRGPPLEGELVLVHIGAINRRSQLHAPFFDGLRELARRRGVRVRLRFVGEVLRPFDQALDAESRGGLVVERTGFLPASEALRELAGAQVALLLQEAEPGMERYQNLKLFDYLGARVPILALAPDPGEITRVVRAHDAGWALDPSSAERAADVLGEWLAAGAPHPGFHDVDEYSWPRLARRLSALLSRAADTRSPT